MAKKLFESLNLHNMTLKNRIVMAPMCMYTAKEDGIVTDWHKTHYESRAIGQVGLIIVEATGVSKEGRITVNDLGIWSDAHIKGLKELTTVIKKHGTKAGIQLAHAGRKSEVPGEVLAPSPLAFSDKYKTPKEMTVEEIKEIVEAFKMAAIRADQAGFDMIEIHGAHGYLINEFLSPLTNKRTDEYGGSSENRYRILREVLDGVRGVWDKPLFVRISAHDYEQGGMTPKEYIPMVKWMKEQKVDLVDVSSGGLVLANIDVYPGYQVPFAKIIKSEVDIMTGAVGLITTGGQAEEILENESADLIFLGRELLRNPYWPYTAAKELDTKIQAPKQYERGWMFTALK